MSATYYRRKDATRRSRKPFVVVVRTSGQRALVSVATEQDAKALVREIRTRELAGINVIDGIRQARTPAEPSAPAVTFPTLREALPDWIDRQGRAGEIRGGTPAAYRSRLATWVYPHALADGRRLGDLPVNVVTR